MAGAPGTVMKDRVSIALVILNFQRDRFIQTEQEASHILRQC
jgi:hypothetical protein